MRQHQSVSYELSEMMSLKRMYADLRFLSPGKRVTLGELELPLVRFGMAFKSNAVIRNNFREFAGEDLGAIQAVANYFAEHQIKPEDSMILVPRDASDESENS